jgi:hypothetical protein
MGFPHVLENVHRSFAFKRFSDLDERAFPAKGIDQNQRLKSLPLKQLCSLPLKSRPLGGLF